MPGQPEEDFAEIVKRAQRGNGGDISSVLSPNGQGRIAFEPRRNQAPAGQDLDFDCKVAVYSLPADAGDYEDAMNLILRGEAIKNYEDRTFDKEGNFLVALCYFVPRPRAARPAGGDAADAELVARPRRLP